MLMNTLFHIAIKSPNIEATREFYCDVLGMSLAERPVFNFPGYWIKSPLPGGLALFHIYGGDAALENDGTMASGAGAIDHVSVSCQGFYEMRANLEERNLPYREAVLPTIRLWQLLEYDPSGILLELSFSQDAENAEAPKIREERRYKPREQFFDANLYKCFGR
jgi:catechol 2,3-dioxygenase-like lactoylglutathione lyase family enzyme